MKFLKLFGAITLFLFVSGGFAGAALHAQNIDYSKLQKEEEERRKKAKKSRYVVTNDNVATAVENPKPHSVIKREGSSNGATAAANEGASEVSEDEPLTDDEALSGEDAETGKASDEKTKEYWQRRVLDLEANKLDMEDLLPQLQAQVAELRNKIDSEHIAARRVQYLEELDAITREIELIQGKLQNWDQQMEQLRTEARKKRVPPGWLRVRERDIQKRLKEMSSERARNKKGGEQL